MIIQPEVKRLSFRQIKAGGQKFMGGAEGVSIIFSPLNRQ
jgi:hypothetical protein